MTCAELEIAFCDYLDGTLAPAERTEVERHLSTCTACAALARDARSAVAFMERVAEVEPPPELVTRMYGIPLTRESRPVVRQTQGWLRGLMHPLLQPRMVMGLSLTILFFGMMARCAGVPERRISASDLDPARVWSGIEDRVQRGWERSVKFYENLRFVYQIQSRVREWQQQQDQDSAPAAVDNTEDHRLPVHNGNSRPDSGKPGEGAIPKK
ncbi:MAG TPA: zf-HC2 domain-containing protein [Bryobacteraceae bacterium]|nr:zf-HC2 domain-containing protein [Bryobacteraceae bacterium]